MLIFLSRRTCCSPSLSGSIAFLPQLFGVPSTLFEMPIVFSRVEPFLGVESTYRASLQAAYRLVQCCRGHPPARGVHHEDGHVLHWIRVDVHAEFLENALQGQAGRDIEKEDAFLGCQCGILETPGDSLDCVHVQG